MAEYKLNAPLSDADARMLRSGRTGVLRHLKSDSPE